MHDDVRCAGVYLPENFIFRSPVFLLCENASHGNLIRGICLSGCAALYARLHDAILPKSFSKIGN